MENEHNELRLVSTMAASAISGALARVPCHPLDTVKARMQTQTWKALTQSDNKRKSYRSFVDGLRKVWRMEGARGLYRGFLPTAIGSIPASCLFFTTYEVSKSTLNSWSNSNLRDTNNHNSDFIVHLISGMAAEIASCTIWVPIDVVKERMQIQVLPRGVSVADVKKVHGHGFYTSGWDAMRSIMKTEGLLGFYRGSGATIMSFGPFTALYFTFYEQIKRRLEGWFFPANKTHAETYVSHMPFPAFLFAGAVAGGCASFCTNPLDVVKLRMQIQHQHTARNNVLVVSNSERYGNMFNGLVKLVRQEGVKGMFRGVGARMAFHAPATAMNMSLYETLKQFTYEWL